MADDTLQVLQALRAASRDWIGDAPDGAMLMATRAFLAAAREDVSWLSQLAAALPTFEPGAAAWAAVAGGTAVEGGAPAELTAPAVLALLRDWLPRFPRIGDHVPSLTPEQRQLLPLFRYLCQAAVTHLAHAPALREQLVQDLALLDRLGELQALSHGAVWVREALLKSSGTLILLHAGSGAGFRIHYRNLSNNFHLFSLMQCLIGTRLPGGRAPDDAIARAARGKTSDARQDDAWWHYGSALSVRPDDDAAVVGEASPREIPRVDGVPVIIAWPALPQACVWPVAFLGPHLEALPADAEIERELTAEEARHWLQRWRANIPRPWWKFW